MRIAAAILIFLANSPAQASETDTSRDANLVTDKGEVSVTTIVKRKGSECPTNVTKRCTPGQPCFANISIEGDAAKALYLMLKKHGVKLSELGDEFVQSKSGAMTCSETDGEYDCDFGYDPAGNVLTATSACEGD